VTFEHLILGNHLVDKLQNVGKAGTARGANTQTNPFTFAAPVEGASHVSSSRFCHADSHR
jgi:hypothetical protein